MELAKVIGQVVSTVRCPGLPYNSLLLVDLLNEKGESIGRSQVAADPIGAGEGGVGIVDVVADQDLAEVQKLASEAICRLDDGSGVLVITDVKGGTPSNCCNKLADAGRVEVIAGISLPMLLRAITYRRDTLDVVVEMALAGAQSGAVRVDNRIRVGE